MSLIRVALDVPIDGLFDYRLKDSQHADVGRRVIVPFGRGRRAGIVVEVGGVPAVEEGRLKKVDTVIHGEPLLSEDVLSLCQFCANYYHHPLGQVVMGALPPKLRTVTLTLEKTVRIVTLTQAGKEALAGLSSRAIQQRALLQYLHVNSGVTDNDLRSRFSEIETRLKVFESRGWIELHAATQIPSSSARTQILKGHDLNAEQKAALEAVSAALGQHRIFLLLGITGSGKTEIYLRLIAQIIDRDQQVLLLVPEINLTPQLEARVRERFTDVPIASLHSDLSEGERLARWRAAQRGEARIVLGTRLAIFTPMPALGLIVVDEEHDESFKQEEGLRYHARDLAIVRGRRMKVPVLLASATPALESYARAQAGQYHLLRLPFRTQAPPPTVRCVDTRKHKPSEGLSAPLLDAVSNRLARKEQSLVFINRRGYSPSLLCYACGWIAVCTRCSARLVFHSKDRQLRCHYCGHRQAVIQDCPSCGNQDLRPRGHGTQRIENELAARFPSARIVRIDRDTTQRKNAFAILRGLVHAQEVDILVGTQMLAKGHDFPHLTLVGIINADAALFSTDFRAAERLFSLLIQVSGRAGRAAIPGQVMIQTDFPGHPLYAAVERQDYESYAVSLLEERRVTRFPPYSFQALLRAEATDRSFVDSFLAQTAKQCRGNTDCLEVFDPVSAPMARVAGKERGHLLFQSSSRAKLQEFLTELRAWLLAQRNNRVRWHIDVDPRNL